MKIRIYLILALAGFSLSASCSYLDQVPEDELTLEMVFNDKTPTQAKLDKGDVKVIFAEMTEPDVYENLGELNTVKYDEDDKTLSLAKKTVRFEDAKTAAPTILAYTTNANKVFEEIDYKDLFGETGGDDCGQRQKH